MACINVIKSLLFLQCTEKKIQEKNSALIKIGKNWEILTGKV